MTGIILAIFAKIIALLDSITAARSANINNADTPLSTRAPAGSAVSSNTYTATKAGYLNASVSSRATQNSVNSIASTVSTIKNRANVKVSSRLTTVFGARKVQRGFVTSAPTAGTGADASYHDVTIQSVADINKCLVIVQGSAVAVDLSKTVHYPASGRLLNSTTLRIFVGVVNPGGTWIFRVRWQVVDLR